MRIFSLNQKNPRAFFLWVGKITGLQYPESLGQIHFWVTFVGVNLTTNDLFFLPPDRIYTYEFWAWGAGGEQDVHRLRLHTRESGFAHSRRDEQRPLQRVVFGRGTNTRYLKGRGTSFVTVSVTRHVCVNTFCLNLCFQNPRS